MVCSHSRLSAKSLLSSNVYTWALPGFKTVAITALNFYNFGCSENGPFSHKAIKFRQLEWLMWKGYTCTPCVANGNNMAAVASSPGSPSPLHFICVTRQNLCSNVGGAEPWRLWFCGHLYNVHHTYVLGGHCTHHHVIKATQALPPPPPRPLRQLHVNFV